MGKYIFGILFCSIFTYLIFAFVQWDLNVGNWSFAIRGITALMAFMWSMLTISYLNSVS